MAGSFKDAFGKAKVKPEMFRQNSKTIHLKSIRDSNTSKTGDEQRPELEHEKFAAEMSKEGVQPLQANVKPAGLNSNAREDNQNRQNTYRGRHRKAKKDHFEAGKKTLAISVEVAKKSMAKEVALLANAYGTSKPTKQPVSQAAPTEPYDLRKTGLIRPNSIFAEQQADSFVIRRQQNDGIRRQLVQGVANPDVELCIGLDFGTSCTKVVVGDRALGKAYAIPIIETSGLGSYLLPSRVWESNGNYSLHQEGKSHRDLKLRLLGQQYADEDFEHAAAFLGLVIRQVRGWILSQPQYAKTGIVWQLNLGLPAASYADKELESRFKALAVAAEAIADRPMQLPSTEEVRAICRIVRKSSLENAIDHFSVDTEVDVVPEISAQVYGFVKSEHFDPKATNIFMVIDVGAGTVDSSIFHVRKESRGEHGFFYYSNLVDKNGVVNLHRSRVDWLRQAFNAHNINSETESSLDGMSAFSDLLGAFPESVRDYFEGVSLCFNDSKSNPDWRFFWERCWDQVFSKTIASIRDRKLSQAQLSRELPLFLCGGGSRMEFYRSLVDCFNGNLNREWGHVEPRALGVPSELQADGIKRDDYDRLAVAYGLSFLRLGSYVRPLQIPDLPPPDDYNPKYEYISKEHM